MAANNSATLSREEASALFNELAAMIDSNLAISSGLTTLEDRELGSIATTARRMRQSLDSGTELASAVASETKILGDPISSAVKAGLKSGNPAGALREISIYLRRTSEFRRQLIWSLIYPAIVVAVGYLALIVSISSIRDNKQAQLVSDEIWTPNLRWFADTVIALWYIPPILMAAGIVCLWKCQSLRTLLLSLLGIGHWGRLSLFSDLLAIQIDSGAKLSDAIVVAAKASEDEGIQTAADQFASEVSRGQQPGSISHLPPLLSWTLLNQEQAKDMSSGLRSLSECYRNKQARRWSLAVGFVPGFLITMFGGGMALLYITTVLTPVYKTMLMWAEG